MKMGKKVREYKAGDFIFAKVKGYPAWPARVQRPNGKKYFVYFYGTGETANLPPNMIFDYAENKDKFLTKTVKRRDFNDGVKQIEYDFANNVPLEDVIGVPVEVAVPEGANNTANETLDETMADTTAADETMADETTLNDTGIEDSDETGALVIDEGKQAKAARKSTAKTAAKETPKAKEPKTPRGRAKKDEEGKDEVREDSKKEEELVSRSGRKIRPKRYVDEHTEENTTLPSPAPKKRRGASPVVEKEKDNRDKEKEMKEKETKEKNIKHFNAVTQAELQDLKQPFSPDDPVKENIIIAYLPSGQYIGIKLFQSRPNSFKNDAARLQWDKQAASNALTLKSQLEKGHISAKSVMGQLVMDLNLTDEEKATLDKGRETDEKKSRVQYLKMEMKLMELDTKIKTCLCLEKADTELCLKIIDELMELDVKPLMLLKHPTTLETIKRMRAYVGNSPSWELSESEAVQFSQQALKIRKQADAVYNNLKKLFPTPEGLTFWEFFMERVAQFKKATEKLTSEEVLELVHEPLEMSTPTAHTCTAAIEAANDMEQKEMETEEAEKEKTNEPEEATKNAKSAPAKTTKAVNNTPKTPAKRQSSRNKTDEKEKEETTTTEDSTDTNADDNITQNEEEQKKDKDAKQSKESETEETEDIKDKKDRKNSKDSKANKEDDKSKEHKDKEKITKDKNGKEKEKNSKDKNDSEANDSDVKEKSEESADDSKTEISAEGDKTENSKESSKDVEKEKSLERSDKDDKKEEKDKADTDEPRAKRSRESKKTDPPPRSPTKRKSKF